MKILILGGTQFVGRHLTEVGLARGHEITLFHRGKTNPDLFPQAEHIHGDRDGQLDALDGLSWDVVIDTCGYVPRVVRQSVEKLQGVVHCYIFISTISVYADMDKTSHIDEHGSLQSLTDENTEAITGETYGGLKVLCERVVEDVMPGRGLIIRPGFIVGPFDHTQRFSYWLSRTAMGGEMLAPSSPAYTMQFIDGRDLAEWTIRMAEQKQTGIFNATGRPVRLGDILDSSQGQAGSDTQFTWVDEAFLQDNQVPMPLFAPSQYVGVHTVNSERAVNAGLKFRPLEDTLRDTYEWLATVENPLKAGLSPEREAELLRQWHESQH